jgi:hypothetical protein
MPHTLPPGYNDQSSARVPDAAHGPPRPAQAGNLGHDRNRTAARGLMGFALLPGSTRVLDRTSRQLVLCDRQVCPLATETVTEVRCGCPPGRGVHWGRAVGPRLFELGR